MNAEEIVKAKWPDAEITTAFAVQPDGSRRWMYCVMSSLKFRASRGKKRILNLGEWRFSEQEAVDDAATALPPAAPDCGDGKPLLAARKEKD